MRDTLQRLTLDLNKAVYTEIKIAAAKANISITNLVEEVLVNYLRDYHQIEFESHPDNRRNFYQKKD